jgi:hypothetical protein
MLSLIPRIARQERNVPRIEQSVDIAASQPEVFRFCHDVARRSNWDEQVARVELLTPPPIRQGSLLRFDASQAGRSIFSWDAEVVSFKFPHSSQLRVIDAASSSPFAPGSQLSWQFSSVGGHTRLTWVWDYRPRGLIARIMDRLGGHASTQRAIHGSLHKLKALLETGGRLPGTQKE